MTGQWVFPSSMAFIERKFKQGNANEGRIQRGFDWMEKEVDQLDSKEG
jgi:hypothetical protein